MEFINLSMPVNKKSLASGQLLIADPFLIDQNFSRAVVLLCEHGEEGSVGFIINRPTQLSLSDLLPDAHMPSIGVCQGGPVQLDTLHMLHKMPEVFGGNEIGPGIFWGGSYEALENAAKEHGEDYVKLLVGYSGWSPGQLEKEVKEGSWIIADISEDVLFNTNPEDTWKKAIQLLGKEYAYLANMPLDPSMN